jgi:hypothetical protein
MGGYLLYPSRTRPVAISSSKKAISFHWHPTHLENDTMFIKEHMQQLSVSDVFVAHARLFRQKISQSILVNFAKGFISSTWGFLYLPC